MKPLSIPTIPGFYLPEKREREKTYTLTRKVHQMHLPLKLPFHMKMI